MILERALRATALAIAVLAFVDPALTRAALDRPTVVVLHGSPADRGLAAEVIRALEPTFDVSRIDIPNAAAYVLAGADLPEGWRPPNASVVFAVTPNSSAPVLRVLHIEAPIEASVNSVAPIGVDLQVDGTGDRDVTVTLTANDVQLRQVTHRMSGAETRAHVPLTFVPSQVGLVRLRIEAAMPGRDRAVADHVLEVNARVWQVLAFDSRPAYPSTFVRRALESDPRFKVATRVVTSGASQMQTSAAPSSLTDAPSLAAFDLVVVGAPDGFGETEAAALQRYLRDRHGAVMLLPENTQGVLLSRLSGQATWQEDRRLEPVPVTPEASSIPGSSDAWAAAEFLWPAKWPPLVSPLATLDRGPQGTATRPAVWQMPIGSGRLVVSSATDGWRSRSGPASGFSAFWRAAAAAAAQATPPVIDVRMRDRLLTPGQWADVSVGVFSGGEPAARVVGTSARDFGVRLWPADAFVSGSRREWSGAFRAPETPGRYRIEVSSGARANGSAEFLVVAHDGVDAPVRPALERDGLAVMAAAAHRGRVVPAGQLASLPSQLSAMAATSSRRERWHPMRSVWWLAPFTLCAAGEWWLRRHRGER